MLVPWVDPEVAEVRFSSLTQLMVNFDLPNLIAEGMLLRFSKINKKIMKLSDLIIERK